MSVLDETVAAVMPQARAQQTPNAPSPRPGAAAVPHWTDATPGWIAAWSCWRLLA